MEREMLLNRRGGATGPDLDTHARLAVCGERAYVVWVDVRDSEREPDLYFQLSPNGGRTWLAEDVRLEVDEPRHTGSAMNHVLCSGDAVYAYWWNKILDPTRQELADKLKGAKSILVRRSLDGGTTWDPPVKASPGRDVFVPSLVLDDEGGAHLAYDDERTVYHGMYVNRSMDGGATWSEEDVRLDDYPSTVLGRAALEPFLATAPGGYVYALWQDKATGWALPYFKVSTDRGASWPADPTILSSDMQRFARPVSLQADEAGRVYVLYSGKVREGEYRVRLAISHDHGASWEGDALLLDDGPGSGEAPAIMPDLAHDGAGNLWVAWQDHRWDDPDILLRRSTDGGESWSEAVRLDGDPEGWAPSERPRLATDGEGNVVAVWEDERAGGWGIFLNASTDGGATWLEEAVRVSLRVSPAQEVRYPSVESLGPGRFLVVWMDTRNHLGANLWDIYARAVELRSR
jgi:hypothetical protein